MGASYWPTQPEGQEQVAEGGSLRTERKEEGAEARSREANGSHQVSTKQELVSCCVPDVAAGVRQARNHCTYRDPAIKAISK